MKSEKDEPVYPSGLLLWHEKRIGKYHKCQMWMQKKSEEWKEDQRSQVEFKRAMKKLKENINRV